MSDRVRGFYVALKRDLKDEDFEKLKNAVLMLKNVISIKEYINKSDDYFNREMVKCELREQLFKLFYKDK